MALSDKRSKHWRLCVHRSHRNSTFWSLTMIQVRLWFRYFVSLNPLSAVLQRDSHFYSIFVDTLDHSSIAFEGSAADRDSFPNFDFFIFSCKSRFIMLFHVSSDVGILHDFSHNYAVVCFFDYQGVSFVEFGIEEENEISINMFDFTTITLNENIFTSRYPERIRTIV